LVADWTFTLARFGGLESNKNGLLSSETYYSGMFLPPFLATNTLSMLSILYGVII